MRHFDHELWEGKWKDIVLRGNLAKLSQNEGMRLALKHTVVHCLTEPSLHYIMWGIGLSACDLHATSPASWRGHDLLGKALEHFRQIL